MAHKHPVYDTDKHFVIDPITKKISTECPKVVLPQHSHRSERFTFELPKEVEGHDMSLCNVVEIHFQNIEAANKSNKNIGIYKVEDLQTDGDTVFGSWLIDGESTYYVGGLMFAIHFACVVDGKVEYNLPTLSYSAITIGETVWNSETIAKEYPDIVAQFEARIQTLEQGGATPEQIESAVNKYLDENPVEVSGVVKTVNGNAPDENGNVEVEFPEGGTVTDEQIAEVLEDYLAENPIEIPEGGNSAQSDWNAKEGKPGHVLNRTHYTEHKKEYLAENVTFTKTANMQSYDWITYLKVENLKEVYVIFDGVEYVCPVKVVIDIHDGMDESYFSIGSTFGANVNPDYPFGFFGYKGNNFTLVYADEGEHTISVYYDGEEIVHKLDPKYLPEVVTDEQIASAVEDYMAEHPNSSQNPTGTKVYVTLADDGTIVIAPDVGDGLTNGVTITASLADDGTIVIGGV